MSFTRKVCLVLGAGNLAIALSGIVSGSYGDVLLFGLVGGLNSVIGLGVFGDIP